MIRGANMDIKSLMFKKGIQQKDLADAWGCCTVTVNRRLNKILTKEERKQVLDLIAQVEKSRGESIGG